MTRTSSIKYEDSIELKERMGEPSQRLLPATKKVFRVIYVLPLEIQLSREEDWDPINWFDPTTSLCLSEARTWISNVICRGFVCVQ